MKKQVYQQPKMRIIPILPGEPLMNFSYDTGDVLTRKKEIDWEEETDDTPSRFGYWD